MKTRTTALGPRSRVLAVASLIAIALFIAACGSSTDDGATASASAATASDATASDAGETATASSTTDVGSGIDIELFFDGALAEEITTEDCTLSGGAETTCYRIVIAGDPVTYETGPFCPDTITDTADDGGIWFDGDAVYDLDGEFIVGLAELYGDDGWQMYDADGNVLTTETAEEFALAARPNVDPSMYNHCVEGRLEWLANGEPITTTALIPVQPVLADAPTTSQGNLGVTLDGVVIAISAPVRDILAAYTIAAFDDCGGHYNPVDGYHLHGAVGCSETGDVPDGETAMFAYAMDGYPIHSPLDDPEAFDLDACNGHETTELGYHYHANDASENLVLECFVGQTVAGAAGGAGGPPGAGG